MSPKPASPNLLIVPAPKPLIIPEPGVDFMSTYLEYIGETEAPILYHRWCSLAALGTFLGRQYSFRFGHSHLHTNLYVMLIGVPATRKSTAIKIAKKVLIQSGYSHISADRTSKEKFLLDLAGEDTAEALDNMLDANLWGSGDSGNHDPSADPHEMWIACDEFNDFIGTGNVDFISMLGNLWDFEGSYENRIKSGKSVKINNPTISILGGNTPVNFAHAFPPEILGQGFFSRLLLVQADPTGKRITFPKAPDPAKTEYLMAILREIKANCLGVAKLASGVEPLLDKIYKSYKGIEDSRFEHYTGRRFSHLLKLCLVISASRISTTLTERDVIIANTILTHTEHLMPKALGEFGKSRNSDASHKILQILGATHKPLNIKDIWLHLNTDLEKVTELGSLLSNLMTADKIIGVGGGFLAKKKIIVETDSDLIDYSILTDEERGMTA